MTLALLKGIIIQNHFKSLDFDACYEIFKQIKKDKSMFNLFTAQFTITDISFKVDNDNHLKMPLYF